MAILLLIRISTTQVQKEYCKEFLTIFLTHSPEISGLEGLVYNMHRLLHLVDDSKNHWALDEFSGFSFENNIQN